MNGPRKLELYIGMKAKMATGDNTKIVELVDNRTFTMQSAEGNYSVKYFFENRDDNSTGLIITSGLRLGI